MVSGIFFLVLQNGAWCRSKPAPAVRQHVTATPAAL